MRVGVVGINHKIAELALRELIAKACQKRFLAGNSSHGSQAFVLLSTCNRTEIYFSSEDLAITHSYILKVIRQEVQEPFEHRLYSYFGYECFAHLARVTSGMDSALIAETEIQGQVKTAYEKTASHTTIPSQLHFLFQKCLQMGKHIRSSMGLSSNMPSLEEAVYNAGKEKFPDLQSRKILFVGVSEVNAKILRFFKKKEIANITCCNRSQENLLTFTSEEGVTPLSWERLPFWPEYDIAIFGTKSPYYLANSKELCTLTGEKKLVLDLSVPRNVDPKVGLHPDITLLNIDQLNQAVDKHRRLKEDQIAFIGNSIREGVKRYIKSFWVRQESSSIVYPSRPLEHRPLEQQRI